METPLDTHWKVERPTAHFLLQTRQVGNFSVCHNPTNKPKQLKTIVLGWYYYRLKKQNTTPVQFKAT